jgi:hypothetical protein
MLKNTNKRHSYQDDGLPGAPANWKNGTVIKPEVVGAVPAATGPSRQSEIRDLDLELIADEAIASGKVAVHNTELGEIFHT